MKKRLSEICTIQDGYPFASKYYNNDGKGVPLIRVRDLLREYSKMCTTEAFEDAYIVNTGDLLVGMDGMYDIVKWQGGKALLNQKVARLIPHDVDADYLYYYLIPVLKRLEMDESFAVVRHMKRAALRDITVELPPIKLQRKFAQNLCDVDAVLALKNEQIETLNTLLAAKFMGLFGDGIKQRIWKTVRLRDIAKVWIGFCRGIKDCYTDVGVRVIRANNVMPMFFDDSDCHFFDDAIYEKTKIKLCRVMMF